MHKHIKITFQTCDKTPQSKQSKIHLITYTIFTLDYASSLACHRRVFVAHLKRIKGWIHGILGSDLRAEGFRGIQGLSQRGLSFAIRRLLAQYMSGGRLASPGYYSLLPFLLARSPHTRLSRRFVEFTISGLLYVSRLINERC